MPLFSFIIEYKARKQMKIRLLSDLHHEFYEDKTLYQNTHKADVLVVAGDLAVGYEACWQALKQFADTHEHVVYTTGNHEYYKGKISEFDEAIKQFSENTNIYFLNPGMKKIGDVTFIGANLWTNFQGDGWAQQACARSISDFSVIKGFSTDKACQLHANHIKFIREAYLAAEGKKVIVTHFLPAKECISPQWQGASNATLNKYFANNEGEHISTLSNTPYWLFGHTHDQVDITLGNTRVIASPYGYNKNHDYKEKILEI